MNSAILNGIKVYAFRSRRELIEFAAGEKKCIIAVNAEKIINADDKLRQFINSNIGYCDGAGAVWAMKKKGFENAIKIPGCELWLDIINRYHLEKTFYLAGAREEIIQKTIKRLKTEYPKIKILGYRNGYLKDENEKNELIRDIAEKKPDIVFIAMGSPKQELFIQELQKMHPAIYQGLGGSYDIYCGKAVRAPAWCINNNLEWAYRLIKQPWRIFRQYKLAVFLKRFFFNRL